MGTLYISHIGPLLEFASCVWNLEYIPDRKLLENMQRRWTKIIGGFENLIYSQRLKDLDLFSIDGRLLRADSKLSAITYQGCSSNAGKYSTVNGGYISYSSDIHYYLF